MVQRQIEEITQGLHQELVCRNHLLPATFRDYCHVSGCLRSCTGEGTLRKEIILLCSWGTTVLSPIAVDINQCYHARCFWNLK